MPSFLRALVALALLPAAASFGPASTSFFVWHITDVHVDPWYTVGSNADGCYCETSESCPRMGAHCDMKISAANNTKASPWGR